MKTSHKNRAQPIECVVKGGAAEGKKVDLAQGLAVRSLANGDDDVHILYSLCIGKIYKIGVTHWEGCAQKRCDITKLSKLNNKIT